MVKSTMTETVPSSGRGGTAAAMAQNEQTTEEHSTLEQQSPAGGLYFLYSYFTFIFTFILILIFASNDQE